MKNKNIFLHVIDEDYKTKKQKQCESPDVSGKAIQIVEQKDVSVIEQLRKMHDNFAATKELEGTEPNNELNQIKQQDPRESMNSLDISELYESYQKLKTEEQELLERKQDLLSTEQGLRENLLTEINKKKKAIETLHLEIAVLENTCKEISQGLANN
jgi:hypothetical protein